MMKMILFWVTATHPFLFYPTLVITGEVSAANLNYIILGLIVIVVILVLITLAANRK